MPKNIGIDLGTTNSCISFLLTSEPDIIPNPEGSRIIPSIIAMTSDSRRLFGTIAKRQMVANPKNSIWAVKRLIGRKFDSDEVQKIKKKVSYQIIKAPNGDANIMLGERAYSPQEISAMFLKYMKDVAEKYLRDRVGDVVITVPAFFNDAQRQATKIAGEIAGLNVVRIINEPTSALIAYRKNITNDGFYAVYDLGGGTFDISIIEVVGDVYKVISTSGDTFLGGNDFDEKILDWICDEIKRETSLEPPEYAGQMQRLIESAEKAKIELSFQEEARIAIPYLHQGKNGKIYNFERVLGRGQFESMTGDLIQKTIGLIDSSLQTAGISPDQISKIILVGGQSRMPLVTEKIKTFFGKDPYKDLNPEEVVAQGAALQAEIMAGTVKDLLLLDVTPLSLGIETKDNTFTKIVEKNTTVPVKKSMIFTTIADNQRTVNIHVLQGERKLASENKSLGNFNLIGIPLAPKGIPMIDVMFEIDANGIVKVSAVDKSTNLSQSMQVEPATGLSRDEIGRIIEQARKFEENDRIIIQQAKIRTRLSEEIEIVKAFYNRYAMKFSKGERENIQKLIAAGEKAIRENDSQLYEKYYTKIQNLRIKINENLSNQMRK